MKLRTEPRRLAPILALGACLIAAALPARATDAELPGAGFLCCNLRTDGAWASDSNYQEGGKQMLAAGTPVKPLDYGRYRVYIEVNGAKQAIGNDYSRSMSMPEFARRWIVAQDPNVEIAKWPADVQKAVRTARVLPGMTRQQVFTAIGYPMSSENPNLDADTLRYWLTSFAEFQIVFDNDRVREIVGDPTTRNVVVMPSR